MPPAVALLNYISCDKLWWIFCQTGIFAGFSLHIIYSAVRISEATRRGGYIIFSAWFFLYLFAERISEAAMGRTGVWGHNMINMTIRELYYTFADFCPKLEFLFIILILPKGTSKLRWGGGGNRFLGVQRCSIGVQRSSVGCSVAQKVAE